MQAWQWKMDAKFGGNKAIPQTHTHVFKALDLVVAQLKEDDIAREHRRNRDCDHTGIVK